MFYDIKCNDCEIVFEINITLAKYEANFENGKQKKDSHIECQECKKVGKLEQSLTPTYFPRFWQS